MTDDLSPHAAQNRAAWDKAADDYQERHGGQLAKSGGTAWGVWQIPEAELRVLGDVAGRDVLELGCGAAQWAIALTREGAHVTGLDNSARQLEYAHAAVSAAGLDIRLVHASAESVPLPDSSFDVAFCDHGAMSFADPRRTVPEVARLLRPGGLLAFSSHTPIIELCWPADADHPSDRLVRDYWDVGEPQEEEGGVIAFQLTYGDWIRLFAAHGLAIEDLIEVRPPDGATSSYRDPEDYAWARRWPMEHIWKVRKT